MFRSTFNILNQATAALRWRVTTPDTCQSAAAPRPDERYLPVARTGGAFAILLGIAVLMGWALDVTFLKSTFQGLEPTKVNAALLFIFTGVSVCLLTKPGGAPLPQQVALALALAAVTAGLFTVAEYGFDANFGIDEAIIDVRSVGSPLTQRMAPVTALSFVLIGTALALRAANRRAEVLSHAMAVGSLTASYVAIVGYVYGVQSLYDIGGPVPMALQTAVGILVLSLSVMALHPRRGIAGAITQDNTAGATARRLLPVLVIAPIVIGWFRLLGQKAGFYGTEFGLAMMVAVSPIVFTNLILWNARVQGRAEDERLRIAATLRESELRYEAERDGIQIPGAHAAGVFRAAPGIDHGP